jgi:hypothetical protein
VSTGDIHWEPYLWPTAPEATDQEIAAVERTLGASLPLAYLAVARAHQGDSPEPGSLRVAGQPRTVECLLHFRSGGEHASWNLAAVDAELRDRLPDGIHPIAPTTSGTFFGLDAGGAVIHLDLDADPDEEPDEVAREVAPDFPAFLAALGEADHG